MIQRNIVPRSCHCSTVLLKTKLTLDSCEVASFRELNHLLKAELLMDVFVNCEFLDVVQFKVQTMTQIDLYIHFAIQDNSKPICTNQHVTFNNCTLFPKQEETITPPRTQYTTKTLILSVLTVGSQVTFALSLRLRFCKEDTFVMTDVSLMYIYY